MKRWIICLAAALAALTVFSRAAELPAELTDALPEGTEEIIARTDLTASGGLAQGVGNILEELGQQVGDVVRSRVRGAAAVLLAVVLGLSLGKQKDIGVLLTMAVCCMVAMIAISYLEPVLDFLRELETLGDLQGDMLGILLKAVGIGLVSEIAGLVCTDAGNGSLGKTLQMLGSAVILYLSLPIFTAMLELIREILREL